MDAQQAIEILTQEENFRAALVLADAVKPLCYGYTGGLLEWLADGEFDKSATPQSLAERWEQMELEREQASFNKAMGW